MMGANLGLGVKQDVTVGLNIIYKQRRKSLGEVLAPWKYVRGSKYVLTFDPQNVTFFHSKPLLDFTSSRMKDLCKNGGKTNFFEAPETVWLST